MYGHYDLELIYLQSLPSGRQMFWMNTYPKGKCADITRTKSRGTSKIESR